mmetsp:Transcript_9841/g.24718  ORF Transcript_9841/g.24718 Transcript_9841/m.24718 type:complete len:163 (+) Transcript_9841:262-750(+)
MPPLSPPAETGPKPSMMGMMMGFTKGATIETTIEEVKPPDRPSWIPEHYDYDPLYLKPDGSKGAWVPPGQVTDPSAPWKFRSQNQTHTEMAAVIFAADLRPRAWRSCSIRPPPRPGLTAHSSLCTSCPTGSSHPTTRPRHADVACGLATAVLALTAGPLAGA